MNRPCRLYLLGFMGAGKSTVADLLADRTNWPRVELDAQIENRAEKSIADIFAELGEEKFREIESEALEDQSKKEPPRIISCGGGVPLRAQNRKLMEQTGLPVLLHINAQTAWKRVRSDSGRPLAQNREKLCQLWEERQGVYEALPFKVVADQKTPREISDRIISIVNKQTDCSL